MKQVFKKFIATAMATTMALTMTVTALAVDTTADSVNVSVTLQSAMVPEGVYSPTLDQLEEVSQIDTVDVSVPEGSTVKDVVNALEDLTVKTCAEEDSTYGCTCSTENCTCTWKKVALVDENYQPTGEFASALNSMKYGELDDMYSIASYSPEGNLTRYEGMAWEYWVNNNYYTLYMDQVVVNDGDEIVLSYDYSTFTY